MEHALRAQINERIDENPAFYERLSEALDRIIRELRARLIDAAEACKQLAELRTEIRREETTASEHGLTPVSFAVYGIPRWRRLQRRAWCARLDVHCRGVR